MEELQIIKLAVLASGNGTNLQALIDSCKLPDYPAEISLVVSDNEKSFALKRAKESKIKTKIYDLKNKTNYRTLADDLKALDVDLICCAGFMRIIPSFFVKEFKGKIVNIHPSLLPSFPGLNAQEKALESGTRITGCTVHFVDEGVDTGPIIMQASVPILPDDVVEVLTKRILQFEHLIYPIAVKFIAKKMVTLDNGKTHYHFQINSIPEGFSSPVTQKEFDLNED